MTAKVVLGNSLDVLRKLPDNSVHAVVTDPPYGLSNTDTKHVTEALVQWSSGNREFVPDVKGGGFMGREWDKFVPPPALWDEVLRVLKPGGYLLCFSGSRTIGLMEMSIRLAGFDIRDSIAWLYGSGMPKGQDIGKLIDKAAGAQREVVGKGTAGAGFNSVKGFGAGTTTNGGEASTEWDVTAPATDDAKTWTGWNTVLKPAFEPILMAQKPFKGAAFRNVLEHSTGALNIDDSRIAHRNAADLAESTGKNQHADFGTEAGGNAVYGDYSMVEVKNYDGAQGRYPSNVILDEDQAEQLDEQSGTKMSRGHAPKSRKGASDDAVYALGHSGQDEVAETHSEAIGGASRFFYVAKANAKERPVVDGVKHETVKPLALMRYLVKLVTPPDGLVVDPFAGSGTTAEAAILEGFHTLAIEQDEKYIPLIHARIDRSTPQ